VNLSIQRRDEGERRDMEKREGKGEAKRERERDERGESGKENREKREKNREGEREE